MRKAMRLSLAMAAARLAIAVCTSTAFRRTSLWVRSPSRTSDCDVNSFGVTPMPEHAYAPASGLATMQRLHFV
jgi:hypothetical protein